MNDYQRDPGYPGVFPTQLDRRRREQPLGAPVMVVCHACGQPLALSMARLETVQGRVFHRCPYCEACSLIRSSDLAALEAQQDPNSALWPFDRSKRLARCQRGGLDDADRHTPA